MSFNLDKKCVWCSGKTRSIYLHACDACRDKRIQQFPARTSREGIPVPAGVRASRLLVFESVPRLGLIYCDETGPQYFTAITEEWPDGDKTVAIWQHGQLLHRDALTGKWTECPGLKSWIEEAERNELQAYAYRAAERERQIDRVWAQ